MPAPRYLYLIQPEIDLYPSFTFSSHNVLPEVAKGAYFQGGAYFFLHEVLILFRVYLTLALEVFNGLLIKSLGFMVVDEISKTPVWAQSVKILTLTIISDLILVVWQELKARVSIFDFGHPYRCSLGVTSKFPTVG